MKFSLTRPARLAGFTLLVSAAVSLLAFSAPVSAQESRAATGIRNRIESGGGKVGAQPAENPADPAADPAGGPSKQTTGLTPEQIEAQREAKGQRRNERRNAQQEAAQAPAAAPNAGPNAAAPAAAPAEPVKKEHDPVEVIGEPYLVYDHFMKGNADQLNQDGAEADTADRPVMAVVADHDGVAATSAGKDATIQEWYTYDFYEGYFGADYDYDYDPTIGTGQAPAGQGQNGANAQDAGGRRGNLNGGQAGGQNNSRAGAQGQQNTAGQRPGQAAGETAAQRRRQNAAMRQTDPFRQQQTNAAGQNRNGSGAAAGANPADGFMETSSFYSTRQGNLRVQIPTKDALLDQLTVSGAKTKNGKKGAKTDWFGNEDFTQGWSKDSKKRRKPPTTLGKMFQIYERLNMMGEREGQGYSDMMSFTHELPAGDVTVLYTADYSGKISQINLDTKKGRGYPYTRKRAVKNTMWAVDVYTGYRYDYRHGVYRDLVAGANNNGNIYFWDAYSRKLLKAVTVTSYDDPKMQPVLDISFAPDCSVVTACMDGCARVITLPSMEIVSLLKGHKGPVFSACFDETGQYVLTGSKDKSACLWDTTTGEVIAAFIGHTGAVRKVMFLTDRYILTCSDDKTARIWELPDEVSLTPQSGQTVLFDENGNPVDEEGNPVDITAMADAGWGTSSATIEQELFATDDEDDSDTDPEKADSPKEEGDDSDEEDGEDSEAHVDAQGMNEAEVPEQSIADAPRGYEMFRFSGPSPVFSMSVNDYYLFTGCQDGKVRVWDIYPFVEKITGANTNTDPNAEQGADGAPGANLPGMPPGIPQLPIPPAAGGAPGPAAGAPPAAGAQR